MTNNGGAVFAVIKRRVSSWTVLEPGGTYRRVDGPRFEFLALPGCFVGSGTTEQEAQEHLESTISFAIKNVPSLQVWFNEKLNALGADKSNLLARVWEQLVRQLRIKRVDDGFYVGSLNEEEAPLELTQCVGAR